MVHELHDAWILIFAVPTLVLLYWSRRRGKGAAAIVFPSVTRLTSLAPTMRQRLRWTVPVLEALAVLGLFVAAARPREGDARTIVRNEGIAIQMVLDRSGSMEEPMNYQGRTRKRIDIVKDVFSRFIEGGAGLAGRKTDLIGLTTFARFTEENCPLVPSYEPLLTTVKNLQTVPPFLDQFDQQTWNRAEAKAMNPLNRTAIGEGLQRAVLSLVTAEKDLSASEESGVYDIKGKVIILLTDGENNAGMDPVEAGRYAAANNIRLYFVVFGELVERTETIFGPRIERELSEDEVLKQPRAVVEPSGGKAFLARDGDALLEVYKEIDQLEKSDVGKIEFKSYRELYRVFLIPALAAAFLALFLKETLFQRIP